MTDLTSNVTRTPWSLSTALAPIATDNAVADARAALVGLVDGDTFTVPLSPGGAPAPTHWMSSLRVTPTEADAIISALSGIAGVTVDRADNIRLPSDAWRPAIAAAGLKPVTTPPPEQE